MSNGIIPPNPTITPPAKPAGQVVQIVSLPDALQNNARAVRLEGEVIAQNKDGTTRVRTPEGDIDINIRGRQPQIGTRLEVDVPAGNPPRNATIRPAPIAPTPIPVDIETPLPTTPRVPTQTTQPPAPQTQQTANQSPQTTAQTQNTKPPLPTQYQAPPKLPNGQPSTPTPAPLAEGQTVRLTPLPPVQAQSFIQQSTTQLSQNIVTSQIARVVFQSDLIAKTALDDTQTYLLQTTKPTTGQQTPQTFQSLQNGQPLLKTPLPTLTPQITIPQNLVGEKKSAVSATLPLALITKNTAIIKTIAAAPLQNADIAIIKNLISSSLPSPKSVQMDVKIIDIKPPSLVPSAIKNESVFAQIKQPVQIPQTIATPQSSPLSVSGTVIGFTPQNLPILSIQWPGGALSQNLALQFPASNLQIGSQITFQIQTPTGASAQTPRAPLALPLLNAATNWPVVDEMFQSIAQLSPQAAQTLARVMPSPANPANLGTAAMLFVASVRAGDVAGWLGDRRIDILSKSGKEGVLKRLMQDAGNIAQANTDKSSGEWRSYPLPMLWQNEISKVMLHLKHDRDAEDKENKSGMTRFIMDLSLTRMGDVQIDGLVRGNRLDLLVRTQMPISLSMQDAMKKAYADALNGTNIYGELGFQGDIKGWVNVLKREDALISNA